jgi:hypothetical protein
MARTDAAASINATVSPIVDYGPDPRGWRLFAALAGSHQRGISGVAGGRILDRQETFTGLADSPQRFSGMAPLGGGPAIVPAAAVLQEERASGPLNDMALRIFAQRLTRGR